MEVDDNTCPNCKRTIDTNLQLHIIHCSRNFKVCQVCKEPVAVADMEDHLKDHEEVKCTACGKDVQKKDLATHEATDCAPKMSIECEYCKLKVPLTELEGHMGYCGSRTEPCDVCGTRVKLHDLEAHMIRHQTSTMDDIGVDAPREASFRPLNDAATSFPGFRESVPFGLTEAEEVAYAVAYIDRVHALQTAGTGAESANNPDANDEGRQRREALGSDTPSEDIEVDPPRVVSPRPLGEPVPLIPGRRGSGGFGVSEADEVAYQVAYIDRVHALQTQETGAQTNNPDTHRETLGEEAPQETPRDTVDDEIPCEMCQVSVPFQLYEHHIAECPGIVVPSSPPRFEGPLNAPFAADEDPPRPVNLRDRRQRGGGHVSSDSSPEIERRDVGARPRLQVHVRQDGVTPSQLNVRDSTENGVPESPGGDGDAMIPCDGCGSMIPMGEYMVHLLTVHGSPLGMFGYPDQDSFERPEVGGDFSFGSGTSSGIGNRFEGGAFARIPPAAERAVTSPDSLPRRDTGSSVFSSSTTERGATNPGSGSSRRDGTTSASSGTDFSARKEASMSKWGMKQPEPAQPGRRFSAPPAQSKPIPSGSAGLLPTPKVEDKTQKSGGEGEPKAGGSGVNGASAGLASSGKVLKHPSECLPFSKRFQFLARERSEEAATNSCAARILIYGFREMAEGPEKKRLKEMLAQGAKHLDILTEMCAVNNWSRPVFELKEDQGSNVIVEGIVSLDRPVDHELKGAVPVKPKGPGEGGASAQKPSDQTGAGPRNRQNGPGGGRGGGGPGRGGGSGGPGRGRGRGHGPHEHGFHGAGRRGH